MKGFIMEKLRNYGLLVKYVVVTQWRKIRGTDQGDQAPTPDQRA
ncbi:hypothetical protein [Rhodococcus artemisiae]|uniref:Uncharacterized protein n=1 Tax=Rhodococcus artemisiae TaxID=714159 RepID=A0ABU7LAB0_9NOCA|nr:hypothetical protein [Rhodococcus artemisiae]MEE2058498.1 hypothetical protein [Rhodococcus artemisiae]